MKPRSYTYVAVVEHNKSGYWAYVPDLDGCKAAGKTVGEAITSLEEALILYVAEMTAQGLPIPELSAVTATTVTVEVTPEAHRKVS